MSWVDVINQDASCCVIQEKFGAVMKTSMEKLREQTTWVTQQAATNTQEVRIEHCSLDLCVNKDVKSFHVKLIL